MKYLIVGAGFTGAALAERLSSIGETVTVIDKRNHIAGNAYDYVDEFGVLVHKYGPHIFHTNSDKIWEYLSRFTEWRPYEHKVRAEVDGKFLPVPVNFETMKALFPASGLSICQKIHARYGAQVPIGKLMADAEFGEVAQIIYDKIFYNYTVKQWGMTPDKLDPFVLARVPIRLSDDDRYFTDKYQAMPKDGYTKMFEKMLDGSAVALNRPFRTSDIWNFDRIIFTGCIDEFFDYRLGRLPYRSLRFVFRSERQGRQTGTTNFPNSYDFTRVTDMRVLNGKNTHYTTLCYEYPEEFAAGENEPYYPVPTEENRKLYKQYLGLAKEWEGRIWFCGRLGAYQYLNMDMAVGAALSLFDKELMLEEAA